jgi:3',5'-cyclic AMP phosphodiesterase CpdA
LLHGNQTFFGKEKIMPLTFLPINRRKFLTGSLAAGLFASLPTKGVFAEMSKTEAKSDHWVFLSDTHVPGNPDTSASREKDSKGILYNPNEHFAAARTEVLALADKPRGVIVTGDFAYLQGKPEDYQQLASQVVPYNEAGIPVHVAFGNHDNLDNFFGTFTQFKKENSPVLDKHVSVLESPNCNLFILDALYDNDFGAGFFGTAQLRWLRKELNARKDKPAILFAHHNLEHNTGSLIDSEQFWSIIKPQKQVKAYVYGHTHVYRQSVRDDVHLINLPALGWEFQQGKQPLGWSDVLLSESGIQLTLHTVNKAHPKNNDVRQFTWLR